MNISLKVRTCKNRELTEKIFDRLKFFITKPYKSLKCKEITKMLLKCHKKKFK